MHRPSRPSRPRNSYDGDTGGGRVFLAATFHLIAPSIKVYLLPRAAPLVPISKTYDKQKPADVHFWNHAAGVESV